MSKSDNIEMKGTVTGINKGVIMVTLENGFEVACTISGRLRINRIRILLGDSVTVEISPYDVTKGRIVWRDK